MNAEDEVKTTYRLDVRMHDTIVVQVMEAIGDISKLDVEDDLNHSASEQLTGTHNRHDLYKRQLRVVLHIIPGRPVDHPF